MLKYVVLIFACLQIAAGQTWVAKVSASSTVLGDALASNPLNRNIIYGAPGGRQLYVSRDRGYTWHPFGSLVSQSGTTDNAIKSIAVNPHDTLQLVVGVESASSSPDRILKSTNGGVSWTLTWNGSFTYYGKPVEFKPEHPDTMYTMGMDSIYRSTDFGSTWTLVRTTVGLFNAWCDGEIRPDSANILFLGDYTTGIWKTTDHGLTWRKVMSSDGEIPSIAIDPFHPRTMYATRFAGGGGVVKSTDGGENWNTLTTPLSTGPGWWITCSMANPGYVYMGVYGANPGGIYVSADYGNSWRLFAAGFGPNSLINYGLLAVDSLSVVASQIDGLWRLQYPASVHVTGPNGGEVLQAGSPHPISWTASNLLSLRIAFSTDNGSSWTTIADSIGPSQSPYNWTPPAIVSATCRVRITDDLVPFVSDQSDTNFTIYVNPLALHDPLGGERWSAGSTRTIDWLAYQIPTLRLEYSPDGGVDWKYITKVPGSAGSYKWVVPDEPSTECKVRITDLGDTTVNRVSDSLFTITRPGGFAGALFISDNGAGLDSLRFGARQGATEGIDPAFGEIALPPKPGAGTFDVRWRLPAGSETKIDFRDTVSDAHPGNIFLLEIQPGPSGYPMTLSWNPESLSAGTYILRDTLTRSAISVDMRNTGTVIIGGPSESALEIVECKSVWYTYSGNGGWLLMSLPVDAGDRRKSTLFPNALSRAFAYHGGYQLSDTIGHGIGYWLKSEQVTVVGCPRTLDTVAVSSGWNIIGALASPVSVASFLPIPDTLFTSSFFGYDQSYFVADSIKPGHGYWVRARASGSLILASGASAVPKAVPVSDPLRGLNTLTVEEGGGHRQVLRFGAEDPGINPGYFDMPPPAPEGGFDVRFASGGMVAVHSANLKNPANFPILLSSASARIKISWRIDNEDKFTYIILENRGDKEVGELHLAGAGSAMLPRSDQVTYTLRVQEAREHGKVPESFSLGRAYPNPFNPITQFRYSLAADARVSIRVYNILGEEVAKLVEGSLPAGAYEAEWTGTSGDGPPASSGVYFIRMNASSAQSSFTEVQKVLLIR
ncbi:MAG TPA: FlgD immunoglobulin-like domain containing protein [Bacteroidota bacterium]